MPILETISAIHEYIRDRQNAYAVNTEKLSIRLVDVVARTWDLGFTAFGGPPVHFQILYQRFVQGHGGKTPWINDETYQELFAVAQSLPGPASTKMLFCMALIHAGLLPAIVAFLLWSLPGAIGMFGLSLGVQKLSGMLPSVVYALLSALNASTVGIIALAAVQLGEKSIKDNLSRILVIFGACAGLCYNALWYFPVLIMSGGLVTTIWDLRLRRFVAQLRRRWRAARAVQSSPETGAEDDPSVDQGSVVASQAPQTGSSRRGLQRRAVASSSTAGHLDDNADEMADIRTSTATNTVSPSPDVRSHVPSATRSTIIICCFFVTFIVIVVTRATIRDSPIALSLFTNMYLAGTIIFGGGPVVIPLLRAYVVEPGWVSSRDFLLGLAIIQAFPGPNFNFAVYLGALALVGTNGPPTFIGAVLGFVGIFTPGIVLSVGVQGLWSIWRTKPAVIALLRGINATAVGLVFTAVYRLWQIGYLTPNRSQGQSLALEPWWVVVAVVTYAETGWFHVPPAVAIVIGAGLGLAWYGVVGKNLG